MFTLFAAFPHINIVPGFSEPIEIATVASQYCNYCGVTETPLYDSNDDEWIMPCHHYKCGGCEMWFNINISCLEYDYGNECYMCENCYVAPRPESYYDEDNCDCSDCRRNRGDGYNRYITPMWERDGLTLSERNTVLMPRVTDIISAECREHNPQMSMATFYVCDYIIARTNMQYRSGLSANNAGHAAARALRIDAKRIQDNIVLSLDSIFRDYLMMACGGELRHYYGIKMPDGRSSSWEWFCAMAQQHGRLYMANAAAELFEDERGWGGSYGGAKWATIARTLEARESGKLDAKTFVDRVFSLQHNGGSALNKASWQGKYEGVYYCQKIGNAHAANTPDFPLLFRHMSPEIARDLLFDANGFVRMSNNGMESYERQLWDAGIDSVAKALGLDWATNSDDYKVCTGTLNHWGDYVEHNGTPCPLHPYGDVYVDSHDNGSATGFSLLWFKS